MSRTLERLCHLNRQLARWHHHQCLRAALREVDHGQYRQREGRRLASAGLGLPDQVMEGEHARDRLRLDGRGGLIAHVRQGSQDRGREPKVGKASRRRGFNLGSGHGSRLAPEGGAEYRR